MSASATYATLINQATSQPVVLERFDTELRRLLVGGRQLRDEIEGSLGAGSCDESSLTNFSKRLDTLWGSYESALNTARKRVRTLIEEQGCDATVWKELHEVQLVEFQTIVTHGRESVKAMKELLTAAGTDATDTSPST